MEAVDLHTRAADAAGGPATGRKLGQLVVAREPFGHRSRTGPCKHESPSAECAGVSVGDIPHRSAAEPGSEAESECSFSSCNFARRCTEGASTSSRSSIVVTWALWCLKAWLSRRYVPWTDAYDTTASVVIPVVDEPVGLFHEVLDLITEQQPAPGDRRDQRAAQREAREGLRRVPRASSGRGPSVPGKRNAIDEGLKRCTGEIVVLVDSDTIWTDGHARPSW